MFSFGFMLFPTFKANLVYKNIAKSNNSGNKKIFSSYFFGNIEKCPFTYWLNGR